MTSSNFLKEHDSAQKSVSPSNPDPLPSFLQHSSSEVSSKCVKAFYTQIALEIDKHPFCFNCILIKPFAQGRPLITYSPVNPWTHIHKTSLPTSRLLLTSTPDLFWTQTVTFPNSHPYPHLPALSLSPKITFSPFSIRLSPHVASHMLPTCSSLARTSRQGYIWSL